MQKKVFFVTGNQNKVKIAQSALGNLGIEVEQLAMDTPEIQSADAEEVAKYSVRYAAEKAGKAVVKADFGMCIPALKGFPGPFVKFINKWLTSDQFAGLYKDQADRKAYFIDALAYCKPGDEPVCFTTKTYGVLVDAARGNNGNMVDGLFIPDGMEKTIAELDEQETIKLWSNDRYPRLAEFLVTQ